MREKRARGQEKHEPLFDFPSDSFDAKTPFQVNHEGVSNYAISAVAESTKKKIKQAQKQIKQLNEFKTTEAVSLPISNQDPMSPQIYEGHHRRMEREERRMQVQERQQLTVMASKIRSQMDMLARGDWRSSIEKIVRIQDISDTKEMVRKRDLALNEMKTFLAKFDEYHRRCNRKEEKLPNGAGTCTKGHFQKKSSVKSKLKYREEAVSNRMENSKIDDHDGIQISIRPFAFGYMVPPRKFPSEEFQLSKLLLTEVESFDLIENMRKTRKIIG